MKIHPIQQTEEERKKRQEKMQKLWDEKNKPPKTQQITTGHEGDE